MKESCDLCGLSLRGGTFASVCGGKGYRFCCHGCMQVFHILMTASGAAGPESFKETELFRKCLEMGIIPDPGTDAPPPRPVGPVEEPENHGPAFHGEKTLTLSLLVDNMWCPSCAWLIEETLKRLPGIRDASCHFSTDRLRCDYDPVLSSPTRIIGAINRLGYHALLPGAGEDAGEKKREFIRFAVSAFLSMNVMMLSFSLYSGFFTELTPDSIRKLSWPLFVLASMVIFYGGRNIYRRAWIGLGSAAFGMETLITAGSLSAYLYSTIQLFSGSIHLYYDTASMLVTLVLLGKLLENQAKDRVRDDLGGLFSLRPTKVCLCSERFPDGRYVAADLLRQGDVFRAIEGDIIPADGLVVAGGGRIDESSLTGEARPVTRVQGDRIRSGARVIHGDFEIRAEGVGADSTLGRMIEVMENALGKKTALEGKTDSILRWFVPCVLILAVGTGLACLLSGIPFESALIRAVTVMVISCPCALGIAIPLARVAGISLAAKNGILVRDFSAFERAQGVNAFVFDKTGTITLGQWTLLKVIVFEPFSERQVLAMAAGLEKTSDHYLAAEIRRRAEREHIPPACLKHIRLFENGVSGLAGKEEVKIGSRKYLEKELERTGTFSEIGIPGYGPEHSFVYMSLDGRPCAVFIFGDRIRENAPSVIKTLRGMGYPVYLVSGDGEQTTLSIAERIGIQEAYGGRLPQEKASFVEGLQRRGNSVAMVGDGINDAPALIRSQLAVAVYSGSHLGEGAADITLMAGDPGQVVDFLVLGRRVNKKIHQNLFFTFVYNLAAIPLAMTGLLTPIIAVCAMLMSSLSVIGNTRLLARHSRLKRS